MTVDKRHSEFGGGVGMVPDDPHEMSAAEYARLMRSTEATAPEDTPEAARVREAEREGRL